MSLTGNEILNVQGVDAVGRPAATTEQTTTGAIAALANSQVTDTVNTAITTAGNGTLTAAGLAGGVITRSGPTGAFTDTTATAALIYAQVGSTTNISFLTRIKNTTAFAQTLAAGSGVTLPTSIIIPANSVGTYLVTINTANTATFVHVSTTLLTNNAPEVVTALTTVGAGVITAVGIAGGVTTRGGSQSATPFTDTTATADLIIAAQPNAHIGLSWEYTYKNNTDATATITGGSGVTVSAITAIAPNGTAKFLMTYTAASTITMVGISLGGFAADAADETKQIAFKASGATTGKTATIASTISSDATFTLPAATGTLAALNAAQTWTAVQTFTNSDLKLLGSSTGAQTFTSGNSGASNFTTTVPAVTGVLATTTGSNLFYPDVLKCSAQTDSITTVLANVTGLTAQTLVASATYRFRCVLPGTADGTSGIKYAFKYTTATLTSIEATGIGQTASAIATQHTTTTTDATLLFDQAAAVIMVFLEGTMVVNAGGTVALQIGTHTGTTTCSCYLGATMEFVRIA